MNKIQAIRRAVERVERESDPIEPLRILPYAAEPETDLALITYPNDMLRKVAQPIPVITEPDKLLMERMLLLSARLKAFGLAAPQVGVEKRIIVITIGGFLQAIANPIITPKGKVVQSVEGCLSLPHLIVRIPRYEKVIIEGVDMTGRKIVLVEDGLIARALQHEVDHLNGVLIIDHLPLRYRKRLLKRYTKGE